MCIVINYQSDRIGNKYNSTRAHIEYSIRFLGIQIKKVKVTNIYSEIIQKPPQQQQQKRKRNSMHITCIYRQHQSTRTTSSIVALCASAFLSSLFLPLSRPTDC